MANGYALFPSREKEVSFASLMFLGWLGPLLSAGKRGDILQSDLERIETHPTSAFFPSPDADPKKDENRSFMRQMARDTSLRTYLLFVLAVILAALTAATTLCQPIIIGALVAFLQTESHTSIGSWLVVALFIDFTLLNILVAQSTHIVDQISFRIRAYLTYRIHLRSLEPATSQATSSNDAESAKVTVLANVDVTQAVFVLKVIPDVITSTIIVGVGAYLLYNAVALVFIGPLLLALVSVSVPIALGSKLTKSQRYALEATERRIRSVGQLIEKTRSIRIAGMQAMAEREVLENRQIEIEAMSLYRKFLIGVVFASDSVNGLSLLVTFGIYAAINGANLDYSTLFTALSVISIMLGSFPTLIQMLPALYEGVVSWGRIIAYVKPKDRSSERHNDATGMETAVSGLIRLEKEASTLARFSEASLAWGVEAIIHNVSLTIKKGTMTVVTGSSGCGKSIILKSLVGEVRISAGMLQLGTNKIAFCDQSPYFLAGRTVRQNIILQRPFDGTLYSAVLSCCCLGPDISRWSSGDETIVVDSVGTSLSGGQRKRLALARALYHEADLLILDDVFTGLDAKTIRDINTALFGPRGFITQRRQEMAILAAMPLETTTIPSSFAHETLSIVEGMLRRTEAIDTDQHPSVMDLEGPSTVEDNTDSTAHSRPQVEAEEKSSSTETGKVKTLNTETTPTAADAAQSPRVKKTQFLMRDFGNYMKSFGAWNLAVSIAATCVVSGINKASRKYQAGDYSRSPGFYIGIYSLIVGSGFIGILVACGVFFLRMIPKSAVSIHRDMLDVLVSSSASFLETNGAETLNRFTNDVNVLDLALPLAVLNSTWAIAAVLASMGVLAAGSVYTLISLAVSLFALYFIQRSYLSTSSQLRTLQIASQAPVIGTLRASCDGRATIRAFNLQDSASSTLVNQVYQASKSAYLFRSLQSWLFLVIGLLGGGVAGTLAALLVGLKSKVNVGWAGVALVNTITLGSDLKMLMNWLTLLEAQLGVVRRIREFIATTPSKNRRSANGAGAHVEQLIGDWPSKGEVVLRDVSAAYGDHKVLTNVSIHIRSGEKIALVGRTGSGKSSLAQLLFGLITKTGGSVHIDGVDLDTVSPQLLRQRLVGAPQFSFYNGQASVKTNLDPGDDHSLSDVVDMIRLMSVGLSYNGRDEAMIDVDQAWESSRYSSFGWQQRLGIARALLRRSALYVMDEPTSGMDTMTHKAMIHNILSTHPKSTMIIVTHHTEGLDMFDRVLRVDEGKIA
ncbi:ABC transporter FUM19 [Colletotrichum gloeosporioides]|uniref:ABC transporter FUM19 n=1 Tax=Colletotrichum gloeosporioides TaxID=474922 RepID=A0A8H4FKM8_COLGL|nr:ABC transporter FUM19 [Colletotrichum gloeosporioides]KAF3805652.1 ABC transporter FUM19 [Colletotrichum gloeosporioides]